MTFLRHRYGAGPLHLIATLASLGFAGWALYAYLEPRTTDVRFLLWFAGAIVAHDLVAWPLYTALNNLAFDARRRRGPGETFVAGIAYVRVPAVLSAIVFLVWLPLILGKSERVYEQVAGKVPGGFLARWLLLTGLLFLGSGLLYAWRSRRAQLRSGMMAPIGN
jgi:hypothetical protein